MSQVEPVIHRQGTMADSCIEYKPGLDNAGQDLMGCGWVRHGMVRQGKASKTNLKEVGEDTGDYFKRANVFPGSGRVRHVQTSQDYSEQDKAS